MKNEEFKSLKIEELKSKLDSLKNEYIKLKLQSKISSIENPIRIRNLRRDIARVNTFIKQKLLNKNE